MWSEKFGSDLGHALISIMVNFFVNFLNLYVFLHAYIFSTVHRSRLILLYFSPNRKVQRKKKNRVY